jgi:hypothetical protein
MPALGQWQDWVVLRRRGRYVVGCDEARRLLTYAEAFRGLCLEAKVWENRGAEAKALGQSRS